MRLCYRVILGLSFILSAALVASASPSPSLQPQIDTLLASQTQPIGIVVKNAQTGEVIYSARAQEGFSPASTMKLLTTAAALSELGPDYQFNTDVYYKSEQQKDAILNGNIYVVFSGDPSLTSDDVKAFISAIKAKGIKTIHGNIVIDDTRFSGPYYARGWSQEDLSWYFAAPIASVIIDENKTEIKLKSSSYMDGSAVISSVSSPAIVQLTADVRTATAEEADSLCQFNTQILPNNHFHFYGCWPQMKQDKIFKVAVTDPNLMAKNLILQSLEKQGIKLNGEIKLGISRPQDYQLLTSHASEKLSEMMKNILQDSNNLFAESLLKTLGFQRYQRGSFQAGAKAVQDILSEKFNITRERIRLFDGSGLSHYDSVPPEVFAQVLYGVYQNPAIKDYYLAGLANNDDFDSTQAGTLRVRFERWLFNKTNVAVKAKTGSMTGMSTLTGYIEKPEHPTFIFVIMQNQLLTKEDVAQAKKFQNDFIKILSQ